MYSRPCNEVNSHDGEILTLVTVSKLQQKHWYFSTTRGAIMTQLNEVVNTLQQELSNHRIVIDELLFERFVSGSPDRVLEAIASQVNRTLDERDDLLINAFQEITEALQQTVKLVREVYNSEVFQKMEHLPQNTRRGVS